MQVLLWFTYNQRKSKDTVTCYYLWSVSTTDKKNQLTIMNSVQPNINTLSDALLPVRKKDSLLTQWNK